MTENNNPGWLVYMPQSLEQAEVGRGVNLLPTEAARNYIKKVGLPTARDENWKYTSLKNLSTKSYSWNGVIKTANLFSITRTEKYEGDQLTIVNGWIMESLTNIKSDGLAIGDKADLSKEVESLAAVRQEENFTLALNTIHLANIVVVKVATGVKIVTPIHLLLIQNRIRGNMASAARIVFFVGADSEISVTEEHQVDGAMGESLHSVVVDFILENNAKVRHLKVANDLDEQLQLSACYIKQAEGSNYSQIIIQADTQLNRNEVTVILNGEGAACNIKCLSILGGEQHVDNHTVIIHHAAHCVSNQRFKGIYKDNSHGVFTGTIIVEPGAQKTNAYQSNANLLLSPLAKVDARPQLKIWADDVKCTHGEACGQLDDEAIFYMQARGLSRDEAKKILVQAFAQEIIDELEDLSLSQKIKTIVEAKILNN